MHKIRILSIGKTKESWLEEAINEYLKRLQSKAELEFVWFKSNEQLLTAANKESNLVCLDATGQQFNSEQFSSFLMKKLESGGSRLSIIIGGAEGLPPSLKNSNTPLISLSLLTFTHQTIRLILIEQIYRAFEIAKGSKYHK